MSSNRMKMTSYKISTNPDALVWYPFNDYLDSFNPIFSNYHNKPIIIKYNQNSVNYKKPANYYHALKFPTDSAQHLEVAQADEPKVVAKRLAAENNLELPNTTQAFANMKKVINARLEQDADFKAALLDTDNGFIFKDTYNTLHDTWGGGRDGMGSNRLGLALMECRNQQRADDLEEKQSNLDDLFARATAERKELVPQPSQTPFQQYGILITSPDDKATIQSTITITPSVPSPTPSATPTATPDPTPTQTPQQPNVVDDAAKYEAIKAKLGGSWKYYDVPATHEDPAHVRFSDASGPEERHFQIYPNKLTTSDPNKKTLAAMLVAFLLLNPNTVPTITVGSKELEAEWKTICAEQHIVAQIKLSPEAVVNEEKNESSNNVPANNQQPNNQQPSNQLINNDEKIIQEESKEQADDQQKDDNEEKLEAKHSDASRPPLSPRSQNSLFKQQTPLPVGTNVAAESISLASNNAATTPSSP